MQIKLPKQSSLIKSLIIENFTHSKQSQLMKDITQKKDVLEKIAKMPNNVLESPLPPYVVHDKMIPICTPLATALNTRRYYIAQAILDKNINLNASPFDFIQLLIKPQKENIELIKLFLEKGLNLDHSFVLPHSLQPIHTIAQEEKEVGYLDFAFEQCISHMIFNKDDINPIAFEITQMLINANAPTFNGGFDLLASSILYKNMTLFKEVLKLSNLSSEAYEKAKGFVQEIDENHGNKSYKQTQIRKEFYQLADLYFEKQSLELILTNPIKISHKKQKI